MSGVIGQLPVVRAALVLVLSILLLGSCGGDGDEESGDAPAPAPSATTTTASGNLELYEIESAGFALGVPESWNAASVDDFRESGAIEEATRENPNLAPFLEQLRQPNSLIKFVAGDPESREGFATNVNVIVEELPPGVEAEEYEQANLANIRKGLALEGEIDEERVGLPAGEALRLEYQHGVGPGGERLTLAVVQYIVTGEGEGYVVTYSTVPEALADYEPQFDESAASFSLL
jgi:hypothetical protein